MGGGNHQVLAAKKYAMTAVSIQTTGASSIDSALLWFPLLHLKVEQKLSHSMKDVQLRLGFLVSGGPVLGDHSPNAVNPECCGTRHPQVSHPPGVPQKRGEHSH